MDVPFWIWAAVLGFIVVMLAVDLFAHRHAHVIGVREAAVWSGVWVAFGVAFGALVRRWSPRSSPSPASPACAPPAERAAAPFPPRPSRPSRPARPALPAPPVPPFRTSPVEETAALEPLRRRRRPALGGRAGEAHDDTVPARHGAENGARSGTCNDHDRQHEGEPG